VHLTRNEDKNLSLSDRAAIINTIKPDLVLSLHVNKVRMSLNLEWSFMLPMNLWHMKNQLKIAFVLNLSRTKHYHLSKAPFYFEKSVVPAIVVELATFQSY
jgi:N-acetylmuramoyl-L-alanine amidase